MKRFLSIVLVVLMVLAALPVSAARYEAGTYSAKSMGFGGYVTVEITVNSRKITNVKVSGPDETEGIGKAALPKLAEAIKEDGADIDAVAGATQTSKAAKRAAAAALKKAAGKEAELTAPKDGRYTVEMIGHEGTVYVSVVFYEGKIQKVEIPGEDETVGVGSYAVKRIPAAIVANQSVNIDSVTGATITSNTIKEGVVQAIEKAGGSVELFSADCTSKPGAPKTVKKDATVAIVGAGTAGIFAAAKLMESGVENVVLFEKTDIPGGCFAMTYGGIFNTNSQILSNWLLGDTSKSSYGDWDQRYAAYFVNQLQTKFGIPEEEVPYRVKWLEQMYRKAGEVVDWMANIGIGMMTLGTSSYYGYAHFAPGAYAGGAGFAMDFLAQRIVNQGAEIIYATPVTELVQAEDGSITGLIAKGEDGTTYEVTADAVLLASGSFAQNEELVDKYFPQMSGFKLNSPAYLTGDGLLMGMEVGANIVDMNVYVPGFMSTYDSGFELAFMHWSTPGIIVNANGDECIDHVNNNHENMAAAKADPKNGDTFYYIFDNAGYASTCDFSDYLFTTYEGIFEKGEAVHYDSVKEASKALDLPGLADAIAKNNELALKGEKNEFGRGNLSYIAAEEDGIWVLRVDPNYYLPTGGLEIDQQTHVINTEGNVIPNLYAAGDVAGSIEAKSGKHYGCGFTAALSYGTIAAETIMADLGLVK